MKQIVADHMNTMKSLKIDSPVTDTRGFRSSYQGPHTTTNETMSPRVSKDFKVKKGLFVGRRPKPYQIT